MFNPEPANGLDWIPLVLNPAREASPATGLRVEEGMYRGGGRASSEPLLPGSRSRLIFERCKNPLCVLVSTPLPMEP
ncbi:hypothetical protein E2C01_027684 [Portunus trituberculatus]|uniref:Uncharacterized protein n=1 Tax=Portunus trituberculatus TaxID=210409 RepID=A0A5B7EIR7_PORTR|nr:hypothetical protein [Portunus trituberculatus]